MLFAISSLISFFVCLYLTFLLMNFNRESQGLSVSRLSCVLGETGETTLEHRQKHSKKAVRQGGTKLGLPHYMPTGICESRSF